MVPQALVSCSLEPSTSPYPKQDHQVHDLPYHFFKTYFNIIFPFTPKSSKWPFFLGFSAKTLYALDEAIDLINF